jgi:hypothetical protein
VRLTRAKLGNGTRGGGHFFGAAEFHQRFALLQNANPVAIVA